ncbi:hypothetical protein [Laribacter hongkongensis]|uniref:hypothetical protein n=1 Tax=Laribacter hongkongensis TaxID=168471 RepID=UPI00059F33EC|nr:hypothetical protein [Laribacter hongkongensis]
MASFFTSEAEMNVLRYLPHLSRALYHALHARMDFATGLVGRKSLISYQALIEETEFYIPRGRGVQRVRPSEKEVRCALDRLMTPKDDLGRLLPPLLVRVDVGFLLEFFMPLASHGSVRSFDTGHFEGRQEFGISDKNHEPASNELSTPPQTGHTSVLSVKSVEVSGSGKNLARASLPTTTTTADVPVLSAEDELMMGRAEQLCMALRRFRVLVHVRQFSDGDGRKLLEDFSDTEILKTAERLHQRHFDEPERSFNLTYLAMVMADVCVAREAAPLSRRGSARGSKGTATRPWFLTASGLEAKAVELGIDISHGVGAAKLEIIKRAGVPRSEYEAACSDFGVPRGY